MYYRKSALFILVLSLLLTHGQAAQIKGKIVNENKAPLPGANVYLKGTVLGSATDANGEFTIGNVPSGKFFVTVLVIGYQEKNIAITISDSGKYDLGITSLTPSAVAGEPVVVTASKYEQKVEDVPVSLSTLGRQELHYRNSITIQDALEYVPGVNMNSSQVNIRGSSGYSKGVGSRVLLLLDGVPFLTGDTREINYEAIPIYMVERVEVLKGAGSALYGSSALGGVINIITRDISRVPQYYAKVYGGTYSNPSYADWRFSDHRRYLNGAGFSYSRKIDRTGILMGVSHDEDDSYRQNDWNKRWSGNGKLQFDLSPYQKLTVAGNYMWQKRGDFLYWWDLNHALQSAPGQSDNVVESRRYYITSHYRYILGKSQYLTVRGIWFQNRFEDNVSTGTGDKSTSRNLNGEVQYNSQYGDMFFTTGFEGTHNIVRSDIFGDHSGFGAAVYTQSEIAFGPRWNATLGARLDYFDIDSVGADSRANPKFGLVYKPWAGSAFRASVGLGFRAPSMAEVFTSTDVGGLQVVPNTHLRPEKSRYFEAGLNQILPARMTLDLSLFYSRFYDLIEGSFLETGQIQFRNVTNARIRGSEVDLSGALFGSLLKFQMSYTYVDPQDLDRHVFLNFRPRHLFYGSVRANLAFFQAGVDYRYISRYDRIDEKLAIVVNNADQRVPIHVVDLRLSAATRLSGAPLRISFQINNLFRYNYVDLVGSLGPLRNFVVTMETGF